MFNRKDNLLFQKTAEYMATRWDLPPANSANESSLTAICRVANRSGHLCQLSVGIQ
jgi:hypothetical protein